MFLAVGKCVAFDGDPWQKGTSTLGFSTLSQHCGLLGNELILKYKACPLPITPSHCILMGPKGGLVVHPTKLVGGETVGVHPKVFMFLFSP